MNSPTIAPRAPYQSRSPVRGAIGQASIPAPNSTRPSRRPEKPVACANIRQPATTPPRKARSTLRGPWQLSRGGAAIGARQSPENKHPRAAPAPPAQCEHLRQRGCEGRRHSTQQRRKEAGSRQGQGDQHCRPGRQKAHRNTRASKNASAVAAGSSLPYTMAWHACTAPCCTRANQAACICMAPPPGRRPMALVRTA